MATDKTAVFLIVSLMATYRLSEAARLQTDVDFGIRTNLSLDNSAKNSNANGWAVFGPGGPKFSDVSQGSLGDCYFLAGMAAVAYRRPELIDKMFVKRGLWSEKVFTMNFLINGHESEVPVDEWMPASEKGFFFTKPTSQNAIWPLLLEKAWAKIFGSFMAIEAGNVDVAFKAITQAPVTILEIDSGIWKKLVESNEKQWPAGVSSKNNPYGIPSGHAFTVLDVSENYKGKGKAVRVYNPWARSKYTGSLSEDLSKGDYWCTWDEFTASFETLRIGEVKDGYSMSARRLDVSDRSASAALRFTMRGNKPFSVQLEWPEKRFFPDGCLQAEPVFRLLVAKKDNLQNVIVGDKSGPFTSNARVDLPGGAGEYYVYVYTEYVYRPELKTVAVNTYAAEEVEITDIPQYNGDPKGLIRDMYGLCSRMQVVGRREIYEPTSDIGGLPALVDTAGSKFIGFRGKKYTVLEGGRMQWNGDNEWQRCTDATLSRCYDFQISQLQCVASSLLQEDATETVEDVAEQELVSVEVYTAEAEKETSSRSVTVAGADCASVVHRLETLADSSKDMGQGKKDPSFAHEVESSIAAPGKVCGDKAQGIQESCSKYNEWKSVVAVMEDKRLHALYAKKCVAINDLGQKASCKVYNTCSFYVKVPAGSHTYSIKPDMSSYYTFEDGVCKAFGDELYSNFAQLPPKYNYRGQRHDCSWASWGSWSACNGGSSIRTRLVKVPRVGSGKDCQGDAEEVRAC